MAFREDRGTLAAAGMAFYWFLSVFPAMLAVVGIAGLAHLSAGTVASVHRGIRSALPGDAASVLTQAFDRANAGSGGESVLAALAGIVVALWSATAGMAATQTGLDEAYELRTDRPFLSRRVRGLVLLAVAAVLGGIATTAIVFGGALLKGAVWVVPRWAVGLVALSTLFEAFYALGPNREVPRWRSVSAGGMVATVIWLLGSLGFSVYVSSAGSYAKTYGSLTGVVVLLLWLYLAAIAVLFGAEVNAELERDSRVEPPH